MIVVWTVWVDVRVDVCVCVSVAVETRSEMLITVLGITVV